VCFFFCLSSVTATEMKCCNMHIHRISPLWIQYSMHSDGMVMEVLNHSWRILDVTFWDWDIACSMASNKVFSYVIDWWWWLDVIQDEMIDRRGWGWLFGGCTHCNCLVRMVRWIGAKVKKDDFLEDVHIVTVLLESCDELAQWWKRRRRRWVKRRIMAWKRLFLAKVNLLRIPRCDSTAPKQT